MKTRRSKLTLTAAAGATVALTAVVLVSSVPEIAPAFALLGILAGGGALAALLAFHRGATPALVTLGMFLSLLALLAVAGGHAFLLWTAAWLAVGVTSKRLAMTHVVERVTRSLVSAG